MIERRSFLASLASVIASMSASMSASMIAGCAAAPPPPPAPKSEPALPNLALGDLTRLLPLAKLRWAIQVKPREIASISWLIPAIAKIAPEENLNRFAASLGFDLRQIPEAVIAAYAAEEGGESTIYLVRHNGDPAAVERLYRARITSALHRSADRPDLVRVSGKIGTTASTAMFAGRDVAAYQVGGSAARGPVRVASLYAQEKLKKSPTLLTEDPLKALAARLGDAPLRAFALGPFEGELSRGARGLLAGATAIGGAVRPSAREGLLGVIAVAGDFSKSGPAASRELATAWEELAKGSFGHLLGLDQPIEKPLATHAADAVAVAVEIEPNRLARGLAAATGARIEEIMR